MTSQVRTMRANHGVRHWRARLTTEQVDAIRDAYERGQGGYRILGKRFGVSWVTVRNLCRYWRRCRS